MATKKTATKRAGKTHDAPEVAHQDNAPKQDPTPQSGARAAVAKVAKNARATKRAGKTHGAPEVAHQDNTPKQVVDEVNHTAPTIYVRKGKNGAVLYMQTVTDTTEGARIAAVGELKRMGYDEDAHYLDMSEFDAAKERAATRAARAK